MKKWITLFLLILLFSAACKKSDDTQAPTNTAFQWPVGTSDYAPNTIGSTFTYEVSSGTPATIDSFTYTVAKDTTIAAVKYYKLVSNKPALAPTNFINYTNGVITNVTYNFDVQGLITIPVITQTILKDNVPVNNSWNELLVISYSGIPVNLNFVYTILQKDYIKSILGKDYANTINAKQVINISLPGGFPLPAGIPSTIPVDNFFAKGVGLIQKDGNNASQKIKRYNIVK
jgi:hypothetical protein